jgi:16S rRNA (adenine1518-N6/adenine1519-N6)-dimethyltransferase
MDIQNILNKYNITTDPLKDQFFLTDRNILKKIVETAEVNKNDVVLEIGAGVGNLTKELAKKARKVIAFEVDVRFKPLLTTLPNNVELHFQNARSFFQLKGKFKKKKVYNKVVSNMPYSLNEPLLHNLTFLDYDKVILLVPIKFAYSVQTNPVFSSFFKIEQKFEVNRSKFYPKPKTNSVVIDLVKLPDPIRTKNLPLFLRQYMYQHEEQKTINSITEGILKYHWLTQKQKLTKNEARNIVRESGIDKKLLEKTPDNPEIYKLVSEKLGNSL